MSSFLARTTTATVLACLLASLPSMAAVRFVALGDAGVGNVAQYDTGNTIAALCAVKGCDFALYLGDNFYGGGIESFDDPQFQTKFEQPYRHSDMPFYVVLGNHDYGDRPYLDLWKPLFEIAYTERSQKWKLPHYFYKVSKENVDIFAIDAHGVVIGRSESDNQSWLARELAASTAQWKIVMAHYPYLSNGEHGNAGNYEGSGATPLEAVNGAKLKRLVEGTVCGVAQVYFSGHDHNLQWLKPACGTEFIVSGAGAKTTPLKHRDNNPTLWESDAHVGFMWVEIDGNRFTGEFYDQYGSLLFRRSFSK